MLNDCSIVLSRERLGSGMWPTSARIWMTAIYLALFILRPWEIFYPWLGEVRFEKKYVICMIVVVFLSRKNRFRMTFQTFSVFFLLASLYVSGINALDPTLSWDALYVYMTVVIFYCILILVIQTPYELVFIVTSYIVSMTLYLTKAQLEFFLHNRHVYTMGVRRLIGIEWTYGGPNWLSGSILLSLPFLKFLWTNRSTITEKWSGFWRKQFSLLLICYFVLAVTSIILTNSRTGMLGFIVFLGLVTARGSGIGKKIGYALAGIALLGIFWNFMPEENKNRFRTIWDSEAGPSNATSSARGRIEGFYAGMTMFDRFPITGVGIGNFEYYRIPYIDGVDLEAHNLVGQTLGESGILGGVAFSLFMIAIFSNCRTIIRLTNDHPDPMLKTFLGLSVACREAIFMLLYEGLFNHNLLRFNWLWFAAFSLLSLQFTRQKVQEIKLNQLSSAEHEQFPRLVGSYK